VEYAMKAIEQGEAVLALRSENDVVICSIKRARSELADPTQKIFKIDDHMGIGIAGLTADARVLAEYMRDECLNHRYIYDAPMNVGRLVTQIADKSQQKTQNSSKRPYGVGLLVVGVDEKGPHLFETCPSGNFYEYHAMAIGGRSTSAKTYLEKHFESFKGAQVDVLIQNAVEALNKTTAAETTLTTKNVSVAVIGKNSKYRELPEDELQKFIDKLEKKEEEPDAVMEDAGAAAATTA
jgi:20S proteasome subunit alpha 6